MTTCATCHQPILKGETPAPMRNPLTGEILHCHVNPAHCVAATARRFEAIIQAVKEGAAIVGGPDGTGAYRACAVILDALRSEFKLEPKR